MIKGLIELLQSKDFPSINVKQLCQASGVNRTTFYVYYDNTYELLQDAKRYMVEEFLSSFGEQSWQSIQSDRQSVELISKEYLLPYLRFIKKNHGFYEVYVKNASSIGSEEYFDDLLKNVAEPIAQKSGPVDKARLNYVTRFYVTGIDAIIQSWIGGGFKESEEYLAELIASLRKD